MLRRKITYTNPFTEQEVTEEHYFHISKADLVEIQIEEMNQVYVKDGETLEGMQAKLQRIMDAKDGKAIMVEFKDIIRRSYGVRGEGDKFIKNDQVWEDFKSSEAFSQLLFELCTKADAGAEFINSVVPHNLDQIAEEIRQEAEKVARQRDFVETASAKSDDAPAEGSTPETAGTKLTRPVPRAEQIAQATAEHPVTLTQDEVTAMDDDELRSGVATGKYRLK